jgi:hypothetical protein
LTTINQTQRRKENQGPIFSALSRETDFDFALSAKLTTFAFDLLCAFASWRDEQVLTFWFYLND